jgi:hypothetical protein
MISCGPGQQMDFMSMCVGVSKKIHNQPSESRARISFVGSSDHLRVLFWLSAILVFWQPTSVAADTSPLAIHVEPDDLHSEPDQVESEDSDDFIIIEDDDDDILIIDESSNDPILIIEEDEIDSAEEADPKTSGPLGRLWEALYVGMNSRLTATGQFVELEEAPARMLGDLAIESWLLPARNIRFFANGFGRLALDAAPQNTNWTPAIDFYEVYAKINAQVGSVLLGRLVIPWGRTQIAAFGDRLNHADHRRGSNIFPEPAEQKQPQWGTHVRTSIGAIALEGAIFALYEPSEGSFAASNQGGVRLARYQTAIIRNPARAGGLLGEEDRSYYVDDLDFQDATVFAIRGSRRVGAFDLGASAVWGVDETPSLHFSQEVAQFLASDALRAMGTPDGALPENPCLETPDCIRPSVVSHERTGSFSADFSWGLGIVILKAEFLAHPKIGLVPGKTALLVSERGLRSTQLSQYAGAVAMEGGFGDWVTGTLEVFDVFWNDVPAGSYLHGVENFYSDVSVSRQVHRVGLGWLLNGTLLNQSVGWWVRGETGVNQGDLLASVELRYNLPMFNLYLGGRGAVFAGLAGSPGWMRQDASSMSIFVGEGR